MRLPIGPAPSGVIAAAMNHTPPAFGRIAKNAEAHLDPQRRAHRKRMANRITTANRVAHVLGGPADQRFDMLAEDLRTAARLARTKALPAVMADEDADHDRALVAAPASAVIGSSRRT